MATISIMCKGFFNYLNLLPFFFRGTSCLDMKPEFWTQGPNSWDPTCQVRPPTPVHQIKRPGEGRERRFITWLGTCHGRGRVSTQPSSAIFRVQTWAIGLSRQKNWGQGTKLYIVKQSQSQVWSGWPLSQSCSEGCSKVVIWSQAVVHPKEGLLLDVASVPCRKDVISSVLPWFQCDCKVTAKRMA
jgi:hypothetical protein